MSQQNLAYASVDVKAIDTSGKRLFSGVASTPRVDRADDILVSTGAIFKTPLPFLWAHDHTKPIGWITSAKASTSGISIEGEVATIDEPGELKDRLDMAWQSMKALLVRGLSVGFRGIETAQIEGSWGTKYLSWEIYEVSAVVVPCNADCSIQTIKAIDTQTRVALGLTRKGVVRLDGLRTPFSKTNTADPRAALGQTRKGVVRLADPPGASGSTKAQPA